MKESKYEYSRLYILSVFVVGVLSGLIAMFTNLKYPFLFIHKNFISETLHLTAIEIIPENFLLIMAFPLYWYLYLLMSFLPIDLLFKYKAVFRNDVRAIVKATLFGLISKTSKFFYRILLFLLCYALSIWLASNVFEEFISNFKDRNITLLPSIFIVTIALALANIANLSVKKLFPKVI